MRTKKKRLYRVSFFIFIHTLAIIIAMNIYFVTGNARKFEAAKIGLESPEITLVQEDIDTPEIQSENVEDVGKYKAKWAAEKLGKPVIVADGSVYFHALNGFPGPFIKFINKWLTAEDMLNLMRDKTDRAIDFIECLAYCEPGEEPVVFMNIWRGRAAYEAGPEGWSPINQVFIPEGYDRVASAIPEKEMLTFWGKGDNWAKFKEFILKKIKRKNESAKLF